MTQLEDVSEGFRADYLDHAALTAQLRAWEQAFPELVRLTAIGASPEGRELWLLTIGPDPDRVRPAVWVDGNMHAAEIAGSSTALAIAEDVLRVHRGEAVHGLGASALETVREVLFHILPRMSPDGAEAVLKTGRYVRSVPRDPRPNSAAARWIAEDMDGDGLALLMRKQDPAGEFVESATEPGLMLPRTLEDDGPFWRVWPEGRIEHFDGAHVPDPDFQSDNAPDLNRNFPWSWEPEHIQVGAGQFPTSEPESRAVVQFAAGNPNLFAWINFHTFGGVFIRPMGDKPDTKMDQSDLALYRQLGEWATALTGYPMVSGFEEFTYEPDTPIRGDLSEWAYAQRGCVSYVCELWDLFHRIGMKRAKRFVEHYTHLTREDRHRLAAWDREHNDGRAHPPWVPVEHPQLGAVEVGGFDTRVGIWNPTYEALPEVCEQQSAVVLRIAALAPRIHVEVATVPEGELTRVTVTVENRGYLPTQVLHSAEKLDFNEPLHLTLSGEVGVSQADRRREIGHLDGWGRGLFDGTGALYFFRGRGTPSRRQVEAVVQGEGVLEVTVGSCRVGWTVTRVTIRRRASGRRGKRSR